MNIHPRLGKYDKAVAHFIDGFWKANYRSPTLREVCEGVGISSTSAASYVVRKVARRRGDVLVGKRGVVPTWVIAAIDRVQR